MSYLPRLCAHQPWPLLVCLFMHGIANATETPTPLSAAEILPYVVHHSQAWGQMGLDTCVYAPGATPAPLQIGDTTYPSGLGFHAPGETWITLERKFSIFECEVGVQKQTANQGSVAFRVYADGELVFDSGVLREADGPRSVRIAVDGVHYLKLEYTDGGDGITCDCANWVNVRLTPSPTTPGTDTSAHQSVDIAPFGRVLTWNPYVKDGTHAMRTESFPARDLFPGDDVARDKDGLYPIPLVQHPFADMGMGCIGLEWLEQRRITQASIQFANTAPNPDGVAVEYWAMTPSFDGTPGVSRWQGHWEHLNADIACEGKTWTVLFTQSRRWKHSKTLKLRWIIPRELATNKIEQLSAYTDSAWVDADITLRATQAAPGQQATVTMYNGLILRESNSTTSHSWDLANPLRIRVRYAKEMPWTRSERTTLRLALPAQSFGIAIADVVDSGCVYVESAGIVATPSEKESAADTLLASSTSKKTVLEEVRTLPDQTFTQAIKHVHRPDADLGPTLLSLANGNAKFLLQRNGTIGFDVPDLKDGLGQTFSIAPAWDGQSNETITRHLEDDWMPIVAIAHSQEAVTVQQRAYIAPYGEANALGKAAWYHDKPLCVPDCYDRRLQRQQCRNQTRCY